MAMDFLNPNFSSGPIDLTLFGSKSGSSSPSSSTSSTSPAASAAPSIVSSVFSMSSVGGAALAGSGMALQGVANIFAAKSEIDSIFNNVARSEMNITQMRKSLFDTLDIQARKVSRRTGTEMARIGRSGVTTEGSPISIMMENYGRGMQDFDAINEQGTYAIDSAYQEIFDELDRASDVATGMALSYVSTAVGIGSLGI